MRQLLQPLMYYRIDAIKRTISALPQQMILSLPQNRSFQLLNWYHFHQWTLLWQAGKKKVILSPVDSGWIGVRLVEEMQKSLWTNRGRRQQSWGTKRKNKFEQTNSIIPKLEDSWPAVSWRTARCSWRQTGMQREMQHGNTREKKVLEHGLHPDVTLLKKRLNCNKKFKFSWGTFLF